MSQRKVQIIGAGFAGLTLAFRLAKSGWQVTVIEQSARVGGLIQSKKTQFGIVETAASSLIFNPEIAELINDINVQVIAANKQSRRRFLFRDHFTRWPLTIKETMQFICTLIPKLILHLIGKKSPLKPRPKESIRQWGYRNLGEKPTIYILEAAMNGIYAGDPKKLSASLILGGLFNKKKKMKKKVDHPLKNYRGIVSTANGMEEIIQGLQQACLSLGVQFQMNQVFKMSELNSPTIIATDVHSAHMILANISPEIAKLLARIPKMNMLRITSFWEKSNHTYQGFGGLIPSHYGFQSMGILFNSMIFNQNQTQYNESQIAGGAQHPDIIHYSDKEIEDIFTSERRQILKLDKIETPLAFDITRWEMKLPEYNIENEEILDELNHQLLLFNQKEKNKLNPLVLHGNYLSGIGLSKVYERTLQLEKELNEKASLWNHHQ